jgi:hypothetical protein
MVEWLTRYGPLLPILVFVLGVAGYFRHTARQSVRELQTRLRAELRQMLREVSEACDAYVKHLDRAYPSVQRKMEAARDKAQQIRQDGLISPSPKRMLQLENLFEDMAARCEAQSQLGHFAGHVPDMPALIESKQAKMDERMDQIRALANAYLEALGRIDRGRTRTYLRYKLLWPRGIDGISIFESQRQ